MCSAGKHLKALPETIGQCAALQSLFMGNCLQVPALPAAITRLENLHTLNLYNCGSITFLHDNFQLATSLRVLSLQGCEKLKEVCVCAQALPRLSHAALCRHRLL